MKTFFWLTAAMFALAAVQDSAEADWWIGSQSYSLSANKYDGFFGQAKPIIWNCQAPRGQYWWLTPCFNPSQRPEDGCNHLRPLRGDVLFGRDLLRPGHRRWEMQYRGRR